MDKPVGVSSHQAMKTFQKSVGARKAGHGGTLDPFATGVIIILSGSYTKLEPYLSHSHKVYQASLELGCRTSTADPEGEVVETASVPPFDEVLLQQVATDLTGSVELPVPAYSAVKIAGRKAYDYARKGEILDMPVRTTSVANLVIKSDPSARRVHFYADVSRGTYIRALGEEIARRLGTIGHLSTLRRIRCCDIGVGDCVTLDQVRQNTPVPLSPCDVLRENTIFETDSHTIAALHQGRPLQWNTLRETHAGLAGNPTGIVMDDSGAVVSVIDIRQGRILRNI
nr:tRNA pseudouridine(55) synthase TruB [Desulfurispira natronophila]